MKRLCLILAMLICAAAPLLRSRGRSPFSGRWDLTITTPQDKYPSWLEFTDKEGAPEVRVVGRVASVHNAADVKVDGSRLSFTTSEWFGKPIPVSWEMTVSSRRITGTQKRSDGVQGTIEGRPAPALDRKPPAAWSNPEPLFDGKDLNGWEPDNAAENHWKAEHGELVNESAGANNRTTRKFQD